MRLNFIAALALGLLGSTATLGQTVSSTGVARMDVDFPAPKKKKAISPAEVLAPAQRREALRLASINAVERYFADQSPGSLSSWQRSRDKMSAEINRYILSTQVVSEEINPDFGQYVLSVRAEINTNELESALRSVSGQMATASGSQNLAFVFVSREQAMVKSFDDRVYKRMDVNAVSQSKGGVTRRTSEGEAIGDSQIDTVDRVSEVGGERYKAQVRVESGGSSTRRADETKWRVANSNEINTAVAGVFANAGYGVVEAEQVPQFNLTGIRKDFSDGDDLQPATMRSAVNSARSAQIAYLVLATMDVGIPSEDANSGLPSVAVKVNAKVYDVRGTFARTVSSVGPIPFIGVGKDEMMARTSALKQAAEESATKITAQLAASGIR